MLIQSVLALWMSACPGPAWAQKGAALAAEPAAEAEAAAAEGGEEAAPEAAPVKKKARKGKAAAGDPFQMRVNEIAKVYKAQIVFGKTEADAWNEFWTTIRNERGKFEQRLTNERVAFVDSLRSLDPKDHGQSLLDFETMQANKMKAFEESQSVRIKDFIQQKEGRLREFGIAQEAERERLAQASLDSWTEERALLNISLPVPDGRASRKERKDKEKEKEKKGKEKKKKSSDDW